MARRRPPRKRCGNVEVLRTEVPLVLDQDHLDLRRVLTNGRLVEFSVNYRSRVDGKWREVVRYDNCHGTAHVHLFFEDSSPVELASSGALLNLLDAAERDLLQNWRRYRALMVGRIRQLQEAGEPKEDA